MFNTGTIRKLLETCVRSRLTYGTQAKYVSEAHLKKLESSWMEFLRHLVKGGLARKLTPEGADEEVHRLRYTNADIVANAKTKILRNFIRGQHYEVYWTHVISQIQYWQRRYCLQCPRSHILTRSLDE